MAQVRKLMGVLISAALDSGPQPPETSLNPGGLSEIAIKPSRRGGSGVAPQPDFRSYIVKLLVKKSHFLTLFMK
jgi:hypothetical protein